MEDRPLLLPTHELPLNEAPHKRCLTGGTLALITLIFAWVAQSEVSKSLQHGSASIEPYNKPYFITILNQSMMVVAFALNIFFLPRSQLCSPSTYLRANGLSSKRVCISSICLAFLYCASTFLWFTSMGKNTVSVSIASGIYNSSVVWVFLLSLLFRIESFSYLKGSGVFLAIFGVALASIKSSSSSGGDHLTFQIGYLEVVGSAMLYALFEVVLKLVTNAAQNRAGTEDEAVPIGIANVFTGTIGLCHLFILSLLLWPLNNLGWEIFEWPSKNQWGMLWLNAGMGTLFNCSFVASIALMSPTLVSVSCLLTIPIAAVTDLCLNQYRTKDEHVTFTAINIIGLCLICSGFLAFTGTCGKKRTD